ncbi:MAG: ABC transporter permease subunit [Actinomycetota bacterium]
MNQVPVYLLLSLPFVGAYAMFALGIVVIHQSSKVLNLAHGAMAMMPAFITYSLVNNFHIPTPISLLVGAGSGALIGILVERFFVRGLQRQGATAQTVGTIAALGLLLGVALKVWGTTPRTAVRLFPDGGLHVGVSLLRWGQLGLFGVAALCTAGLFMLFRTTDIGMAMRAAADNRRGASMMGIDPNLMARISWAMGGALAAVAGILLAPVSELHPVGLTLIVLPAFVAALIGGLSSLPGAAIGSVIVGVTYGMVPAIGLIPGIGHIATQVGAPQLVLTLVALVVMALRGERFSGSGSQERQLTSASVHEPRPMSVVTRATSGLAVTIVVLLIPQFLPYAIVADAIQAGILLLVASSLVLLTGWVGQISLAQATLVGIGTFGTALIVRQTGLQFPLNLPVAAIISGGVATIIGLVALRVRGLYLAVATLIVLWMSNEFLFRQAWLVGAGGSAQLDVKSIGHAGGFPYFDFTQPKTMFYVVIPVAAAAYWALANLRDSKTGRAFFAVRGSEIAAASLGVDVRKYKLLAFTISGVLAGIAGNLLITSQQSASPAQFDVIRSLLFLAVAVVGGISSLGGAVGASILFIALQELFSHIQQLEWLPIVTGALLSAVLLAYPEGIAGAFAPISSRFRSPKKRVLEEISFVEVLSAHVRSRERSAPIVLEATDLVVQFGGNLAVNNVSLTVREQEIIGLIGPNGAGKTTTFNAISGLVVPSSGTVQLFGKDVTDWPVHRRSALGVGRTFQIVQLFGELSIFENLLVATHMHNTSGVFSHMVVGARALRAEREANARVTQVISMLGLQDIAERQASGLSLGTLRKVEVARALVTGAKLVMLDEPASGLDNNETEKLAQQLLSIRDDLGVSILLIEHDIRMVTSVSDYIYVVDHGAPLAQGRPSSISNDPAVIAAYLGEPLLAPDQIKPEKIFAARSVPMLTNSP